MAITSQYWMLLISTPQSGSNLGLSEIELRDSVGGTNLTTDPLKLSAPNTFVDVDHLIDGNVNTTAVSSTITNYLIYDFTTPVTIGQIYLKARDDNLFYQAPTKMALFFKDSNPPNDWVIVFSTSGMTWTQGSTFLAPVKNTLNQVSADRIDIRRSISSSNSSSRNLVTKITAGPHISVTSTGGDGSGEVTISLDSTAQKVFIQANEPINAAEGSIWIPI